MWLINYLHNTSKHLRPRRAIFIGIVGLVLVAAGVFATRAGPDSAQASIGFQPSPMVQALLASQADGLALGTNDFATTSAKGFGDSQNSVAWSMKWWEKTGKLYVGTNRSWMCWSYAAFATAFPLLGFIYPPLDPDIECTPDYTDLPLQAEIWAWTPPEIPGDDGVWERVFQSEKDVPIAGTEKFAPRDIGFRTMAIFTEQDGTEALYVAGVNSSPIHDDKFGVPPPRILRSTDGINFEPIPQDPFTVLGDLSKNSFRSLTAFNDKLYVIHTSVQGNGKVYEATNPELGNDAWRQVSPEVPDLRTFELQEFNGFLYAGVLDLAQGYAVIRLDTTGEPPYEFTTVVPLGGYLENDPSKAVVSMHVFNNYLYVGTDDPAELIRIDADDNWDLIVGTARRTPDGPKVPLSGLDEGFAFTLNDHIWRMQEHDGYLYVGTYDKSTSQRLCQDKREILQDQMGLDLYRTSDGIHFSAVNTTGFGDIFDYGVRTLQSTPYGLFVGTSDLYTGFNVFRGFDTPTPVGEGQLEPPGRFEAISVQNGFATLLWDTSPEATEYTIYRSEYVKIRISIPGGFLEGSCINQETIDRVSSAIESASDADKYAVPAVEIVLEGWQLRNGDVPLPATSIGTTTENFFLDTAVARRTKYAYYVVASDDSGRVSGKSNLLSIPLARLVITPSTLTSEVTRLQNLGKFANLRSAWSVRSQLNEIDRLVSSGYLGLASFRVQRLHAAIAANDPQILQPQAAERLEFLLMKYARRVDLAYKGVLSASELR